jgi:outer membrane protein OmpA-like peptidoglycan-associated protein
MRKSIIVSTVLALTAIAPMAMAEDVSLHVSGGAAENLSADWDHPGDVITKNKFDTGVSGEANLLFPLVPNLAVGPDVSVLYLPQTGAHDQAAVIWDFGVAARLQGVRGDNSWSPYLQGSFSAAKQATIWNPAFATTVGADFAVDSSHTVWVGPYLSWSRTFQVHDDAASQTAYLNHDDGNTATIGLSLSFDAPVKPRTVTNTVVNQVVTERVVTQTVPATPAPVVAASTPESFQLPQHVLFQKDSSTLDVTAQSVLDTVASELSAHPGYSVVVEGSASAEGESVHNLSLSQFRATSVVDYLVNHGNVDRARLNTVSVGAVGNPNDGSNRKVDFLVITLVKN